MIGHIPNIKPYTKCNNKLIIDGVNPNGCFRRDNPVTLSWIKASVKNQSKIP